MKIFPAVLLLMFAIPERGSAEILQGRILEDHTGTAVPSASVKVKNSAGTTLRELDTDGAGRFAVMDIPDGIYQVTISKPTYVNVSAKLTAQSDGSTAPILRLVKLGVISGRITSPKMGGSVVAIEEVQQNQIPRTYTGMINASGEFRIFGIAPGRYVIATPMTGNIKGFALYPNNTKPREFVISGGEQFEVLDFQVSPLAMSSITGMIASPAGTPPYTLTMAPSVYPSIRLMIALSSMDGSFRFDNIYPGSYELYVSGPVTPPSYFAHMQLSLNSDEVRNLNIQLKPGRPAQFDLRAVNSGTFPACSAEGTITLQSLGNWPLVRDQKLTAFISPQTPAHFDNLAPGPFLVTAQSAGGNCLGISDRIVDGTSNIAPQVVRGFSPTAVIHGNSGDMEWMVLRDVTSGRDSPIQAYFASSASEFRFEGLAPGQYCVTRKSVADPVQRWLTESGCSSPLIALWPGDSREVK